MSPVPDTALDTRLSQLSLDTQSYNDTPTESKLSLFEKTMVVEELVEDDEVDRFTDDHYLTAARMLDRLVLDLETSKRRNVNVSSSIYSLSTDNTNDADAKLSVMKLVHSTMKYMEYIDKLLEKTKFMAFHAQLSGYLSLVRVLLYEMMRVQFERKKPNPSSSSIAEVTATRIALEKCKVSFAAEYARIRIERQARGDSMDERLSNILPESVRRRESYADEMPKYILINKFKLGFIEREEGEDSAVKSQVMAIVNTLDQDDRYTDLYRVPMAKSVALRQMDLCRNKYLVFVDKACVALARYTKELIKEKLLPKKGDILVTNPRSASFLFLLSHVLKKNIVVTSDSPEKTSDLEKAIQEYGIPNITIISDDFLFSDLSDPRLANVNCVISEPPNTSGAVVDHLEYLQLHQEYPFANYSEADIELLSMYQYSHLIRALELPKIKILLYMTRSVHAMENENVIERLNEDKSIELLSVRGLEEVFGVNETVFEGCLRVPCSKTENGLFLACIKPIQDEYVVDNEEEKDSDTESTVSEEVLERSAVKAVSTMSSNKKKRGKRSKSKRSRRRSSYLNPTLAFKLKSTSSLDRDFDISHYSSRSVSQPNAKLNGLKLSSETSENVVSDLNTKRSSLAAEGSKSGPWRSLTVFGKGLQAYYEQLRTRSSGPELSESRNRMVWSYPVPNPNCWR